MHFLERASQRAIPRPRRCNLGQAEQRQRVATSELKQYPQDRRRGEQHIESHVSYLSEEPEPASEGCHLWWGWPVDNPPNEAQYQEDSTLSPAKMWMKR